MTSRVRWEVPGAVLASLAAMLVLVRAIPGILVLLRQGRSGLVVVVSAWALASLLAAGFGIITAVKLRGAATGRALALLMSLVALVLAGAVNDVGGKPGTLHLLVMMSAFWAAVGTLLLFSHRIAGLATLQQLQNSRRHTTLAGLVRPGQVVWLMRHRAGAWWLGLALILLVGSLAQAENSAGRPAWLGAATPLALVASAALTLLLAGSALSNIAAKSTALSANDWRATRWLLWALFAPAVCYLGSAIPGVLSFFPHLGALVVVSVALEAVGPVLLALGVIFAVVGLGAVDPSLALRRTVSIGMTGLLWVSVSTLGQDLASRTMSSAIGAPGATSWVIVLGTAAVLAPLQRRIERWLEHRTATRTGAERPEAALR